MSAYSEYLKSQGASDADIAVLDTPIAQRAFDDMQAKVTAAASLEAANRKWYEDEIVPNYTSMQQQLITARAEAAKAREVVLASTDAGLLKVAEAAGFKREDLNVTPPNGAPDSRYISKEDFLHAVEKEGDAIAIAQDIAAEHARLFPDKTLNFRDLRREAVSRHMNVEQLWMDRYGVTAARDAAQKAATEKREAVLREEGAAKAREEFAAKYSSNPDMRPGVTSNNPFAPRAGSVNREKAPWEVSEGERSSLRVQHEVQKLVTRPN